VRAIPRAIPIVLAATLVAVLFLGPATGVGAPSAPVFGQRTVVDPTRSGTEPSLRIAPDGTVYVAAPCGLDNSACKSGLLWRSDDHGRTFQLKDMGLPLYLRGAGVGSGDSELALPANGNVVYADLWAGEVSVSTSMDRGESFLVTNPVGGAVPVVDRQWMEADGDTVYLAFQQLESGVYVVKSTDGGVTFPFVSLALPRVSSDGLWHVGIEGNLALGASHEVYMVYPMFRTGLDDPTNTLVPLFNTPARIMVAKSVDGGLTWTSSLVAQVPGPVNNHFPALATDSAGNLYVAWSESRADGSGADIWFSRSLDGGQTWLAPLEVSASPQGDAHEVWIVAGAPGKVAIAYYGTDAAASHRTGSASDDALYYARLAYSLDATSATPAFSVMDADPAPVHQGDLGRSLFDFVTVRVDPTTGRLAYVYASDYQTGPSDYGILTTPLPVLGPFAYIPLAPAVYAVQTDGPTFG